MKILIIGNCQAVSVEELIKTLCVDVAVTSVRLWPTTMRQLNAGELDISSLKAGGSDISTLMSESDLILLQSGMKVITQLFEQRFPLDRPKIKFFPPISFTGFHPDMINIGSGLDSPTGGYHSSIACYGWVHGFSVKDTVGLFSEDVFQALGFFDYWELSIKFFIDEGNRAALPLDHLIDGWSKRGIWMHTINHPKLFVLADLAREILAREGLSFLPNVEQNVDVMANGPSWMVYPEIAHRLGVEGKYQFKRAGQVSPHDPSALMLGLEDFVHASFEKYATYRREDFDCDRLASSRYQELGGFLKRRQQSKPADSASPVAGKPEAPPHAGRNPYQDLPDYQFWRRAIERMPMGDVDPVLRSRFTLGRHDKVATAGSCFAQHISRTLQKNGFNYYIAERGDNLLPEEAQQRNYGVFSARYGNLYTTRQLLQLFDRAYGRFIPADNYWMRDDGKLVDPFRPQIEPEGFASVEELEKSRAGHFMAVREMFESLDIFVFTLGLTEAWRSRIDGAVYPLAPGVVAGEMNPARHEFVNFGISEVVDDMQLFVEKLLGVNPRAKMILTVSPVPLIATYEDRHVLVANTYSKSVLRVVAEAICKRKPICDYFPSYEIITGNYTKGGYFENDLRSVKVEGVDHVMRLFLAHYAAEKQGDSFDQELMREMALVSEVVCDEEAIDAVVADKGVQKSPVPFISLKRLFSRLVTGKNISG